DRGLQIPVAAGDEPVGEAVEHAAGQALPAMVLVHGDLPHEERVGPGWADVAGDEAAGAAGVARHHGSVREVTAPERVAVGGVEVQDTGVPGHPPELRAVGEAG